MFHIHGISISSNTTKLLYVAEELGAEYKFTTVDMMKGEHKTPEHIERHPLGKVPSLTHNGKTLFESSAICRYMAAVSKSDLYPTSDPYKCGQIDQWMAMFTSHLGAAFNSYAFEKVAKVKYGFGTPNQEAQDAALADIKKYLPPVDTHLAKHTFLAGDKITIADCFAFAYTENAEMADYPIAEHTHFSRWYSEMKQRPAIGRAWTKLGRG